MKVFETAEISIDEVKQILCDKVFKETGVQYHPKHVDLMWEGEYDSSQPVGFKFLKEKESAHIQGS